MPHIDPRDKPLFDPGIESLVGAISTSGQLNYVITRIVWLTVQSKADPLCYDMLGEAIKAFECAKLEFYRLILGPHEDGAIDRNGSAYK